MAYDASSSSSSSSVTYEYPGDAHVESCRNYIRQMAVSAFDAYNTVAWGKKELSAEHVKNDKLDRNIYRDDLLDNTNADDDDQHYNYHDAPDLTLDIDFIADGQTVDGGGQLFNGTGVDYKLEDFLLNEQENDNQDDHEDDGCDYYDDNDDPLLGETIFAVATTLYAMGENERYRKCRHWIRRNFERNLLRAQQMVDLHQLVTNTLASLISLYYQTNERFYAKLAIRIAKRLQLVYQMDERHLNESFQITSMISTELTENNIQLEHALPRKVDSIRLYDGHHQLTSSISSTLLTNRRHIMITQRNSSTQEWEYATLLHLACSGVVGHHHTVTSDHETITMFARRLAYIQLTAHMETKVSIDSIIVPDEPPNTEWISLTDNNHYHDDLDVQHILYRDLFNSRLHSRHCMHILNQLGISLALQQATGGMFRCADLNDGTFNGNASIKANHLNDDDWRSLQTKFTKLLSLMETFPLSSLRLYYTNDWIQPRSFYSFSSSSPSPSSTFFSSPSSTLQTRKVNDYDDDEEEANNIRLIPIQSKVPQHKFSLGSDSTFASTLATFVWHHYHCYRYGSCRQQNKGQSRDFRAYYLFSGYTSSSSSSLSSSLSSLPSLSAQTLHKLQATENALALARGIVKQFNIVSTFNRTRLPPEVFIATISRIYCDQENRRKYNYIQCIQTPDIAKTFSLSHDLARAIFYMYRLTHQKCYRCFAWQLARAIDHNCRVAFTRRSQMITAVHKQSTSTSTSTCSSSDQCNSKINERQYHFYVSVTDLNSTTGRALSLHCDEVSMDYTFLSNTLKFLYLTFCDDDQLPLDKWHFNVAGHPLPVLSLKNQCEKLIQSKTTTSSLRHGPFTSTEEVVKKIQSSLDIEMKNLCSLMPTILREKFLKQYDSNQCKVNIAFHC